MPIKKSQGFTPTERLLAELCEKSFLKLWSYPNPQKEDGNELCDLLAVFENHVFIFFDRESRQFEKLDSDPMANWARWKRKVIDDQTRTAHGAERYIRSGRKIYLDRKLDILFPIPFDSSTLTVHKIVVAHGAKEACKGFSDQNVYGSLGIAYADRTGAPFPMPFFVELDRNNPVHVFDSHNLELILSELDSFFDFTQFLDAKLAAIRTLDALTYCGEEDLLAHYFLNYDKAANRHFIGVRNQGELNGLWIGEGEWKDFIKKQEYHAKKTADEVSYFWDGIIQRTCQNVLDGTILGDANLLRGPSAIHEMAKEPRFTRRALSEAMILAIRNFPDQKAPVMRNVSFMPSFYEDKGYVFLQLKVDQITDYENDYRPKRRALLEIACGAAKNMFKHLNKVIGIAIDAPKFTQRNSEDFLLMDCSNWSDKLQAHYEGANEGINFFKTAGLRRYERKLTEFPTES
jgi:hypothetical protein